MGTSHSGYSYPNVTNQGRSCSWVSLIIKPASNGTEIIVDSVNIFRDRGPIDYIHCFAISDTHSCAKLSPGGSGDCRDLSLIYNTDSLTFYNSDYSISCAAQTCPHQVNFKSQSHSGDSEIEAVLTTELGTTYSKVFTVNQTYGDKIIDFTKFLVKYSEKTLSSHRRVMDQMLSSGIFLCPRIVFWGREAL